MRREDCRYCRGWLQPAEHVAALYSPTLSLPAAADAVAGPAGTAAATAATLSTRRGGRCGRRAALLWRCEGRCVIADLAFKAVGAAGLVMVACALAVLPSTCRPNCCCLKVPALAMCLPGAALEPAAGRPLGRRRAQRRQCNRPWPCATHRGAQSLCGLDAGGVPGPGPARQVGGWLAGCCTPVCMVRWLTQGDCLLMMPVLPAWNGLALSSATLNPCPWRMAWLQVGQAPAGGGSAGRAAASSGHALPHGAGRRYAVPLHHPVHGRCRHCWSAGHRQLFFVRMSCCTDVFTCAHFLHRITSAVIWRGTPADSPVKDQAACGSCWVSSAVKAGHAWQSGT